MGWVGLLPSIHMREHRDPCRHRGPSRPPYPFRRRDTPRTIAMVGLASCNLPLAFYFPISWYPALMRRTCLPLSVVPAPAGSYTGGKKERPLRWPRCTPPPRRHGQLRSNLTLAPPHFRGRPVSTSLKFPSHDDSGHAAVGAATMSLAAAPFCFYSANRIAQTYLRYIPSPNGGFPLPTIRCSSPRSQCHSCPMPTVASTAHSLLVLHGHTPTTIDCCDLSLLAGWLACHCWLAGVGRQVAGCGWLWPAGEL